MSIEFNEIDVRCYHWLDQKVRHWTEKHRSINSLKQCAILLRSDEKQLSHMPLTADGLVGLPTKYCLRWSIPAGSDYNQIVGTNQ